MHIPDNYLSPQTCAVMAAAMVPVWAVAVSKVKKDMTSKKIPLLGVLAAFSFLVMMFNVPLPGGTTGHAVGGTLIAILIGPFAATLSITAALLIQALFFGDGGIVAFGANCFNMAFIIPWAGYFFYKVLSSLFKNDTGRYISAFIAGYTAINLAALCAAIEFGLQPLFFKDLQGLPMYCPYPLHVSIPAMMIPHLLVAGFVEAIVTAGVYAYIQKRSPEIIQGDQFTGTSMKPLFILLGIMALIVPVGLIAPGTAWGEWASEEIRVLVGFIPRAMEKGFHFTPVMPDYDIPALKSPVIAYLISALSGGGFLLMISKLLAPLFKKKSVTAQRTSK